MDYTAPIYEFSPSDWADFFTGISREWLITNGLGSYASSTLVGANTRRYHGLLVAALDPPVDRWLFLSKIEEELGLAGKIFPLSTNQYRDIIHPSGFTYLTRVALNPFPTFFYHVNGVLIKKEIFMVHFKQITIIRYEVLRTPVPVSLYFHLLATSRPFHNLLRANSKGLEIEGFPQHMVVRVKGKEPSQDHGGNNGRNTEGEALWIASDRGYFYSDSQWYFNFQYIREKERGLDFEEDLFRPGCFTAKLREGESVTLVASLGQISKLEVEKWRQEAVSRALTIKAKVQKNNKWSGIIETLATTSDTFIVRRNSANSTSILAGYHWFSDWGRDAFVSLPGLTLVLGRFEEAKKILQTFGKYCKNGLVPNSFLENSRLDPIYNSVDASLWFINAIYEYWRYTGDAALIKELYPLIMDIISNYNEGTSYGIKVSENGLVFAGDPQLQLTWMDAKVGPWVVTPRHGSPVEVNALWYNALMIAIKFSEITGLSKEKTTLLEMRAENLKNSFLTYFYNPLDRCLYDCLQLREDGSYEPDPSIRPNQIFAVSLPFSMMPTQIAGEVVERAWKDLYTPYGLRTLSPSNPNYKGQYQGDRWLRDGAYHQGTVWPWLIGPFITAYLKVYGKNEKTLKVAEEFIAPLLAHLWDAGVGSISEIFWGDFPHASCGTISQAWSVAEALRVIIEELLDCRPSASHLYELSCQQKSTQKQ